jgi:uncharacterized protein (DUF433 family)
MATELVDAIPLDRDASGVYRVSGTRVTLDLIVRAFNRGATAEEIVADYPTLQLADVYQVIGYYLKHGADLAVYLEQRDRHEQELIAEHAEEWSPRGLRDRLLARRKNR